MTHSILIVGPAWVGDMVMAQTLFRLLKRQQPTVAIDVLAPAWTFSLLACMPEVRKPIASPFQHGALKLYERYRFAKTLRDADYSQAIVLPNSLKAALMPWFAGIPKRTGWRGEMRYFALNDVRRLDQSRYPLMIQQFMALGLPENAPLPPLSDYYPQFYVSESKRNQTAAQLNLSLTERPVLALCPGAEFGPSKRWPAEYYAAVAKQKLADGFAVWLFGSAKDQPIAAEIMTHTDHRCVDLTGRCPLPETIDLFSGVTGIISNDSGLMHIAAALNKPVIALYGSTSPAFTPPLSQQATILKRNLDCQPCFARTCPLQHHRCMRELTPDLVIAAIAAWQV